jgi:hypothetical protein
VEKEEEVECVTVSTISFIQAKAQHSTVSQLLEFCWYAAVCVRRNRGTSETVFSLQS